MKIKKYFLNNHDGVIVRKLIVREESSSKLISLISKMKDALSDIKGGKCIFEKKISKKKYYIIISFKNQLLMHTWQIMKIAILIARFFIKNLKIFKC